MNIDAVKEINIKKKSTSNVIKLDSIILNKENDFLKNNPILTKELIYFQYLYFFEYF